MDLGLKDRVAFVSGGSRGIGFAVANGFAAEGAKVAISGRNEADLEAARERLAQVTGEDRVLALVADMGQETEINRCVDSIENQLGPIDAIVANVGTGTAQPGVELGREHWDGPLNSNLISSGLLASCVLPRLAERGRGSFTFISSIAGVEVIRAPIPYSAAKAGLMMAMKSYAQQLGPRGVRVNAVAPGNIFVPGGSWASKFEDPEKKRIFREYIRNEVPLRRFAAPKEIADVVVFMASNRASFMTGSVVVVDGGQTRSYV